MRIIFYNPHTNIWFKKPFYFYLTNRKSQNKYEYLLNYVIKNKIDFSFLVDGRDFSFGNKYFNSTILAKIEIYIWSLLNYLNPLKFKILSNINALKSDDVLFIFIYSRLISKNHKIDDRNLVSDLISELKSTQALKVVHLSHYMYDANNGGINTKEANIDFFVAENNLKKNSQFFNKYFSWYDKDVYVLPFVAQKRFVNVKPFSLRLNKAVATGSLSLPINNYEFADFFKTNEIHPMRRLIFENANLLSQVIDSFIYEITENKQHMKFRFTLFNEVSKFIFNHFGNKQTKYFSFNIVDLYNNYKMFVVPEEINGLPGIGFIEGLMCGCVLIGKSDEYYEDLGFIDGVNFISYDGTLNDLVNKITFYQNNPNLLESISVKSYEFVRSNFNENVVSSFFIDKMKALVSSKIY